MPHKKADHTQLVRAKTTLLQLAAKFIANDGESDYQRAITKAARTLNIQHAQTFPSREQLEAAVLEYQSLFQADSQPQFLHTLQNEARAFMHQFERFSPILTGMVANGTAHQYSPIEIDLLVTDTKEFDFMLLDRGIAFDIKQQPSQGNLTYHIESPETATEFKLQVYQNTADWRQRRGHDLHTLSMKQLDALLAGPDK